MSKSNIVQPGALVRVVYKKQSGNYRWYKWEMTAVFLGTTDSEIQFSLRPKLGTMTLWKEWEPIIEAEVLKSPAEIQALGGVRDRRLHNLIKLPQRFPGAVEPPKGME